jgi:hypothetical protein
MSDWKVTGETSDGYHTFNELYDHRITLFIALCLFYVHNAETCADFDLRRDERRVVWRSKLHSDGTSFDGWFVLGIGRAPGTQITYHLPLERWNETDFAIELERAPEFDGHTSADVLARLKNLEPL